MPRASIAGLGKYLPKRIVTNHDLEKWMDTNDAWIRERTGIETRHWAEPGKETAASMGAEAARQALKQAGLQTSDVDFIVFATLSPEYTFPGSGCLLGDMLGLNGVGALDIRTQCTGFVYGLSVADQFIRSGMYKTVLVVGGEVQSTALNLTTEGRDVAVIFGDGAGAAVLTATDDENKGILTSNLHADGKYARELFCEAPGSFGEKRVTHEMIDNGSIYPYMNGRYVFKHAVTRFPESILETLRATGYSKDDIDLIIPHQANKRITEAVQQRLDVAPEKVFSNIHKYGNTTAASIPIAMTEAMEEGRIRPGDLVCTVAFGSGFTWGANLIRF
ncbi:MAG: ketoacyl-ACP synthase III [Calditrichaeota bacterium]|nr:MAG: ketoacyl-ACP synthase III [Calditrichota bacterium]